MGNTIALPEELVIYVLDYLKHKIFVNMRLICKYVNELILNKGHRLSYYNLPLYELLELNMLNKLSVTSSNVRFVVNINRSDEYVNDELIKIRAVDHSKITVVKMAYCCDIVKITTSDSEKLDHILCTLMLTNVRELKLLGDNAINDNTMMKLTNITCKIACS